MFSPSDLAESLVNVKVDPYFTSTHGLLIPRLAILPNVFVEVLRR